MKEFERGQLFIYYYRIIWCWTRVPKTLEQRLFLNIVGSDRNGKNKLKKIVQKYNT